MPWLLQPIELAAIAGIFSCFLAIHNTTVRAMLSMGRDNVLPQHPDLRDGDPR